MCMGVVLRIYATQISSVLNKNQVKSTCNQGACMMRLMMWKRFKWYVRTVTNETLSRLPTSEHKV